MHEINRLATWYRMNQEGLLAKNFGAGYPYTQGGIVGRSSVQKPVIRYVKNYDYKGKRYSLCLITLDKNSKKVEAWLDEQSKKIKAKDIVDGFNMLKAKYEQ